MVQQKAFLSSLSLLVLTSSQLANGEVTFSGEADAPDGDLSLWYRRPAKEWTEALPVGNGRLGAMVFGGVDEERIQLNEDTLWAGGPYDPVNPEAQAALPEVRRLVFDGKYRQAADLISQQVMAKPLRQMPYQTVGSLILRFPDISSTEQYRRELDLDTAVARVTYTSDDVTFVREAFISPVDQVVVIRFTASRPGKDFLHRWHAVAARIGRICRRRRRTRFAGRQWRCSRYPRRPQISGAPTGGGPGRRNLEHGRPDQRRQCRLSNDPDRSGYQLQELSRRKRRPRGGNEVADRRRGGQGLR